MSYPITLPINLGSSKTGLTLYAELRDSAGAQVGADVTAGFVERGNGTYLVPITIPDDFAGIIEIHDDADDAILAVAPVDGPSNADALLQRSTAGGADEGWSLNAFSVANALRAIRKWRVFGGVFTAYKENGDVAFTEVHATTARNPTESVGAP